MPNLFTCFSARHCKPYTATNTASDTAGVKRRWAALPQRDVQALSDPGFVHVLESAADHIKGHPRAARHVMDCLQGKGAPDDTDIWLQGQRLEHPWQGICATLFCANRFGHTESESKSLLKIAYVVEQLKVQREITLDDMIADMVTRSVDQGKAALKGYSLTSRPDRDDLAPYIQPFLENQWNTVLDTCLLGQPKDVLPRIQTLNFCPATLLPPPEWQCAWHQICFDALFAALQRRKTHPLIQPLLDRVIVNVREFHLPGVPLSDWAVTRLIEWGRTDRETFPWLSHAVLQKKGSMQALQQRLDGFLAAQDDTVPGNNSRTQWQQMLAEAREAPAKKGHYVWYAYPQLRFTQEEIGCTPSENAQQYGIEDVREAQAYLEHPILGERLRTLCRHLLNRSQLNAETFFGSDACKFQSCLTLFACASQDARYVLARGIDTGHQEADKKRWEEDETLLLDCLQRFHGGRADLKTEHRLGLALEKRIHIADLEDLPDDIPTTKHLGHLGLLPS